MKPSDSTHTHSNSLYYETTTADAHVVLIADDIMHAAHSAVLDLAVTAVRTCGHDRKHGHRSCPTCTRLAAAVDWLDAYR